MCQNKNDCETESLEIMHGGIEVLIRLTMSCNTIPATCVRLIGVLGKTIKGSFW
jgi:hypothetical protein